MTVCIAAECVYEGHRGIVMCCDWQGTKGGYIKSDDMDKMRWVDKATVMMAGTPTSADELVFACKPTIREFTSKTDSSRSDLDVDEYIQRLRTSAEFIKQRRVDNYLGSLLGFPAATFWAEGKNRLSEAQHDAVIQQVFKIGLDATLLIGSIDAEDEPVIMRIDDKGQVHWEDNFSVIGSGGPIAEAFLHQYEWDDTPSLQECLFRVYSAKVASEKSPTVGETTSFEIHLQRRRFDLSDESFGYLKQRVVPRVPKLKFPTAFLEERVFGSLAMNLFMRLEA